MARGEVAFMDAMEVHSGEHLGDLDIAWARRLRGALVAGQDYEPSDGLPSEVCGEALGGVGVGERRARADHLQLAEREPQPVAQAPNQHRDLCPLRTSVEVRLVEDQDQPLVSVRSVVVRRLSEDVALDRAQQHAPASSSS